MNSHDNNTTRRTSIKHPVRSRRTLALGVVVAFLAVFPAGAVAVIPGDHPDPSLLRTGNGWYAAATSGSWLPALPILRSADLRRWRQVGAVFERPPRWVAGDFWAPELQRRDGRVLAYYSARSNGGRRCVAVASAERLRGPYRDHGPLVCTRVGAIDPFPARDEYGGDWLLWKEDGNSVGEPTPIVAAPLAPGGAGLAGPPRELLRADAPWERGLIEAPAVLRFAGTFYLVYSAGSCCGPRCTYVIGIARAASLLGPWEKHPGPLPTGNAGLRCLGHASVARGPGGTLLLAHHAYVRGDPANRRLLITQLRFGADGWPEPSGEVPVVGAATPSVERFLGNGLGQDWQWPLGARPTAALRRGRLVLGPGAVGRQARTDSFVAETDVAWRRGGARPGLAVMASRSNAVGVELRDRRAVAWRRLDGRLTSAVSRRITPRRGVGGRGVALRIVSGPTVRVEVRPRRRWISIGGEHEPPRWTSGPRVALRVSGEPKARAAFEKLVIRPVP